MAKYFSKITNVLLWAFILRLILVIFSQPHPDIYNHVDWGIRLLNLGPKKFYENIFWNVSWPNQPFGSMILFALFALIKNVVFNFIELINQNISYFPSFIMPYLSTNIHVWMVKLPFILSDIAIGYLIYKIILKIKPKQAILACSLFLFNPVLIYNSAIWGQTDSLINLLAILGIYLAFQKKYFLGIFLFLLTFIFKFSLIIYLPICGLFLIKRYKDWKHFLLPIIAFFIFIIILAIPFTFGDKTPIDWLIYMYTNRVLVRQGSMLNGNAFNFWVVLFGIDFSKSEFTQFLNINYQLWGRILYIIFIIPIWIKFLKQKLTLSNLLKSLLLSSFGSFIFLTNMHERYLYPIFPLFILLIFISEKEYNLKSLLILTIVHFLNLYNLWFYPYIALLKTILINNNFLFCRILSFILLISCFYYYSKFLKSENK